MLKIAEQAPMKANNSHVNNDGKRPSIQICRHKNNGQVTAGASNYEQNFTTHFIIAAGPPLFLKRMWPGNRLEWLDLLSVLQKERRQGNTGMAPYYRIMMTWCWCEPLDEDHQYHQKRTLNVYLFVGIWKADWKVSFFFTELFGTHEFFHT